ncbi:carboxymuconolactone decarboxylase family protein [Microbacterium sp. YMB-B2]|uniref:Carboxymuconolactone decarboxylase family protein n=1 Tax=Microbacterium tenebrionis TaxID=2830665 RepID=A0A9X1S255_9MICO|nr:carboxymuconolactone decarboxylase family protein [Microbacterium tenebrionis]MCC2030538.1 carboxymuconolactone decarboxylase family protein [Microbacterium tenebrionis]
MNSTLVGIPSRLDIDTVAPLFSRTLAQLDAATTKELDSAAIDPLMREMIRLRASQLNGCAYCVSEHSKDALSGGEQVARLLAVSVWRESPFFTRRERAALALTESVTLAAEGHVPDADWRDAAAEFGPAELGALVALIVTINAWNAVGVTTRAWTPSL